MNTLFNLSQSHKFHAFTLLIILYIGSNFVFAQTNDMVKVEGGTLKMGYTKEYVKGTREGGMYRDVPPFEAIVKDFLISPFEVTQGEFESIMGFNPSQFKGKKKPVESVTWFDAIKYCNLLSKKEGLTLCYTISEENVKWDYSADGYRLLTEAEWEYAARGGNLFKNLYEYSGSDNADEVAWTKTSSGGETQNVGQKKPNELGIYDMSGNVSEWCWDWFAAYTADKKNNSKGPLSGTHRVERGGSWKYPDDASSITRRHFVLPGNSYYRLGFRIGRSIRE